MEELPLNFRSELRISAKPVIIGLAICALVVFMASIIPYEMGIRVQILAFSAALIVLSGVAWLVNNWRPIIARWFAVLMLIGAIPLTSTWLGVPGSLAMASLPVALAAALISLRAAVVVTALQTAVVLALPGIVGIELSPSLAAGVTIALWTTFVVMCAIYLPVHRVAAWAWEYYERAQTVLEETRRRRIELEQALDDLSHANRQLALANERLSALRLIAEQAQESKAAFVARVSHEFRTPLNIIIGMVNLMVEAPEIYDTPFPSGALEHLKITYRNCQHLASMIDDVLDLSQAEAGRMSISRELVDLAQVIHTSVDVVKPLMREKGIEWQVKIPGDLPRIYCDQTRIRQVTLNLLSNAARFTDQGAITVAIVRQDSNVVLSVSDTGPGIPAEEAETIFEPFFQGTVKPWEDKAGSGLGLSISRQFVKLHGGRMWLESEVGVGTTFFVELPIAKPAEHITRPGHQIREDWVWVERTSKPELLDQHYRPRILICDETGDLAPALAHRSDAVEFVSVQALQQAAEELRHCPAQALVINSPEPDQLWPLVQQASQVAPDTPIMGCVCPPRIGHALDSGAVDYLTKPVTRAAVCQTIEKVGTPVRRVLIVDDDPDTQELLALFVHTYDDTIEVTAAGDGAQAMEMLRQQAPDLMFLDVVMPDTDGWQILALKAGDEALRNIPTVMISAQDTLTGPMRNDALLVTMGDGLPLGIFLDCTRSLSGLLLRPT